MADSVFVVSALCGTCGHRHSLGGCADCATDGKQCVGWTPPQGDPVAACGRELDELYALDGEAPILNADESRSILESLTKFESVIFGDKSQAPGHLATIHLAGTQERAGGQELVIKIALLYLTDAFWKATTGTIELLAALAQEWFGIIHSEAPNHPPVGWALVAPGEISDQDGKRQRAHIALASDIDGRAYSAIRLLGAGQIVQNVRVAPQWARLLRGDMDHLGEWPAQQLQTDKLSDGHIAVMHLMLVTRIEMENLLVQSEEGS